MAEKFSTDVGNGTPERVAFDMLKMANEHDLINPSTFAEMLDHYNHCLHTVTGRRQLS